MTNIQIIGITRFSYLSDKGFRRTPREMAPAATFLHDPDRLQRRLEIFKSVTLPALINQTDPNFLYLILVGEDMPKWVIEDLQNATQGLNTHIVAKPPMRMETACDETFHAFIDPSADVYMSFCLDDDDAMSVDWVEKIRDTCNHTHKMLDTHSRIAIGSLKGILLQDVDLEIPKLQTVISRFPYGIGLAHMSRSPKSPSIYSVAHNNTHKRMPLITLSDDYDFVRYLNADSDSMVTVERALAYSKPTRKQPGSFLEILRERFAL